MSRLFLLLLIHSFFIVFVFSFLVMRMISAHEGNENASSYLNRGMTAYQAGEENDDVIKKFANSLT